MKEQASTENNDIETGENNGQQASSRSSFFVPCAKATSVLAVAGLSTALGVYLRSWVPAVGVMGIFLVYAADALCHCKNTEEKAVTEKTRLTVTVS